MSFRECRNNAGLSLRAAAEKIGVSYNAIHLWEIGKCWPSGDRLEKTAEVYGVTVEKLIDLKKGG